MASDAPQRLFQNLLASHKVYKRLLEVAGAKQRHILRNDEAQLRAVIEAEDRLAAEGAVLATQRDQLHALCRDYLKVRQGGETLNDLCRFMPNPWRERFQKERHALKETLEKLQTVNRLNVSLVNNSLELMEGLLAALFNVEPVSAYGRNGIRARPELVRGTLDARA